MQVHKCIPKIYFSIITFTPQCYVEGCTLLFLLFACISFTKNTLKLYVLCAPQYVVTVVCNVFVVVFSSHIVGMLCIHFHLTFIVFSGCLLLYLLFSMLTYWNSLQWPFVASYIFWLGRFECATQYEFDVTNFV